MSNARFRSENAIGQFNQSEQGDKEPCSHRDRRENKHDGAAWVENAKGKQHTKNPTGGTNGRVYASVARPADLQ
jgi:hypothetical protein